MFHCAASVKKERKKKERKRTTARPEPDKPSANLDAITILFVFEIILDGEGDRCGFSGPSDCSRPPYEKTFTYKNRNQDSSDDGGLKS